MFTKKKLTFTIALFLLAILETIAQTIVVDKDEDFPVAFASVFNQDGKFLGQTDAEGVLPSVEGAKSIKVTHIAYEPLKVKANQLSKTLKMKPVQMKLNEAVIAKPKSHCIRLTGFLRNYVLTNQVFEDEDPVLRFFEGTGHLYIFLDGKKSNKWADLAARDSKTGQMVEKQERVHLSLKSKSINERILKSEKTKLNQVDGYQQIIRNDTTIGTVVKDTVNKIIRTDIDYLFPDTVRTLNLVIIKLRVTSAKENYIYADKEDDDDYVSQSSLLAYQNYMHYWTNTFGMRLEGDRFEEFYVDKAEFLTEDEYKSETKALKEKKKAKVSELTSKELDEYITSHHIPDIPEELVNSLEVSRQISAKKAEKKKK